MKRFVREIRTVFAVISLRRKFFSLATLGLVAASLLVNVGILAFVTGGLPSGFAVNDGSMEVQADLQDSVDQFLNAVFPSYNYPFAWFVFSKVSAFTNEYGFTETVNGAVPLFLNLHYFVDFAPFALLISAYTAMSRHYFSGVKARAKDLVGASKGSLMAGTVSAVVPGVGSGVTTALTAVAAGICCGGFAVESSIVVLGFAVSAAGFVLISRVFMLAMAGFLVWGIFRVSRKINEPCSLPSTKSNNSTKTAGTWQR